MSKLTRILLTFSFVIFTADAQLDPTYPLVNVTDSQPTFPLSLQKVYVTTVALTPTAQANGFNPETFLSAAVPFYSSDAGLIGYLNVIDIVGTSVSATQLLVNFKVIYSWNNLLTTPDINNQLIQNTIGNYDRIVQSVGAAENALASFYIFEPTSANFAFTGESLCAETDVTCSDTQTQCTESLDGVALICQSPCKLGYCENNGTCAQEDGNSAPACSCLSKSDIWFIGERCQLTVALWMVILAVVVCFLLIVAAIALACWFYAAKRRRKEKEGVLITDVSALKYTNKAFVADKVKNTQPYKSTSNGYQERHIGVAVVSRRSYSSSDQHSRRRRRRSSSSNRHRRSESFQKRTRSRQRSDRSPTPSDYHTDRRNFAETSTVNQDDVDEDVASRTSSSDAASSVKASTMSGEFRHPGEGNDVDVSTRDHGTSPIRWMPSSRSPKPNPGKKLGKIDISERKGWKPSLGPQMFDIDAIHNQDTLPSPVRLGVNPSEFADTDI